MTNKIERSAQEKRTAFVVIFTFCMMLAEIIVGLRRTLWLSLPMEYTWGSHVLVIGLNWGAYVLVRRLNSKDATQYDGDKILNLSAFTSGIFWC